MQKRDALSIYIGSMLRQRRNEIGLTGKQLAKKLNISQQHVSRYEIGATPISVNMLYNYLINLDMMSADIERFVIKINEFYFYNNNFYHFIDEDK